MSIREFFANTFGFSETGETNSCDVEIRDGQVIGSTYHDFGGIKKALSDADLAAAYERISCVGTSIDLISNNMQMIESVFWNDASRSFDEYPTDKKLIGFRNRIDKPNATDNRKSFITKSVKSYILYGAIYYAFVFGKDKQIVSIRIIDFNCVTPSIDISNSRVDCYTINNSGAYNGNYTFNGAYYLKDGDNNFILAPYINSDSFNQYMPASILQGCGIEALMYWYGCFHNKTLLTNGARPSLIFLIKSMLQPKHREILRNEIRVKHSGAGNAGSAIILDGAADKDVKQFSQNNKDMEFNAVLESAESAIYKRLGVNWVLGKNVASKDFSKGMEMFFDMTVCPMFQAFFNHIFNVYKYMNTSYQELKIFYLEQDIPALRPRFLSMMKDMPGLGIFTVAERRAMYNYKPLGDDRDNELSVQSVKVVQSGMTGSNETGFTKDEQ